MAEKNYDTQIADLKKQLEEQNKNIQLIADANTTLKEENRNLMEALGRKNSELIAEAKRQFGLGANDINLEKEAKPTLPTEPFTVGDKNYKFRIARFQYKRKGSTESVVINAADAMTDPELLAELVEKGAGCVVEVA